MNAKECPETTHFSKTIKPPTLKDQNEAVEDQISPTSNDHESPFYILSDASLEKSRNNYSLKTKCYASYNLNLLQMTRLYVGQD